MHQFRHSKYVILQVNTMEETSGKFCTSHQFSGKKGARARKVVVTQNVDCCRPIITSDGGTDSDETIIMPPHPTTRETSHTETKLKSMASALPDVEPPTEGM